MYRILSFALAAVAGAIVAANAQPTQKMDSGQTTPKILVACFSATGTTARIAGELAEATGGDLHAIIPARPYTSADLDWTDRHSRSSVEMNDPNARPEIGGQAIDPTAYEVIFIGYPIWWDLAPRIINTFIESHDLRGKRLIPFATSGGSGIANSVAALKRAYPELNWQKGRLLNRPGDIRSWLEQSGWRQ